MTGSAKQSMAPLEEWIASAFAEQLRRTSRRVLVLPTRDFRVYNSAIIARFLEPAGEAGASHGMLDEVGAALDRPLALATGEAGTVYLCHPFLVHAAQMHAGAVPRFMAQAPLHPAEPFRLEREGGDYSPVEIAIRQALREGRS